MNENSSPDQGQNNRGPQDRQQSSHPSGHSRGGSRGNRRNDSRGPRRDHRDNNRSEGGRPSRERSNYGGRDNRETKPARPLTFWQKIVAFFSGKSTAPVAAAPASVHPTVRADRERTEKRRSENQRPERSETPRAESNRAETGRPSDSYRRTETRPSRDQQETHDDAHSGQPTDSGETRAPRAPREERPPRTVEIVEVTSPKLYVGNLSFDAAESDLFDLFNGVGKVRNAEVVSNNYTQKSKGFAFVTMETIDEAKRAVVELHDKEFMGRKLLVSGAKTNDRDSAA